MKGKIEMFSAFGVYGESIPFFDVWSFSLSKEIDYA
jgi:hypothetical protein